MGNRKREVNYARSQSKRWKETWVVRLITKGWGKGSYISNPAYGTGKYIPWPLSGPACPTVEIIAIYKNGKKYESNL